MNLMGQVRSDLENGGYSLARRDGFVLSELEERALVEFRAAYAEMPEDPHLNPGEGERYRRYARLAIHPRTLGLSIFPHDRFYQSKVFDVLYGDIHRDFPAMTPELVKNPFFQALLRHNFLQFPDALLATEPYEISVHMIRIAATPGNRRGRPAPEGIHRDGYDFAAIHLMDRHNLSGAENRIYSLKKETIFRTHLVRPLDSIYLDDRKVFHGVEPFVGISEARSSHRDMLILLYQPVSQSPQPRAIPAAV